MHQQLHRQDAAAGAFLCLSIIGRGKLRSGLVQFVSVVVLGADKVQ